MIPEHQAHFCVGRSCIYGHKWLTGLCQHTGLSSDLSPAPVPCSHPRLSPSFSILSLLMDLTLTSSQLLQFPTGKSSKRWQELSVAAKMKWYLEFRLDAFPHTVALPFTAPTGDVQDLQRLLLRKVPPFVWKKTQKRILITGVETAPVPE